MNTEGQGYASTSPGTPDIAGKPLTKVLRGKERFPTSFRGSIDLLMHLNFGLLISKRLD